MTPSSTAHGHRWGRLLAFALALPLAGSLQPAAAATLLSYISSPRSWIGLGETVAVGPEDGYEFTPWRHANNHVYFWINNYQSSPDPWSSRGWGLTLMGPMDDSLSPGTYDASTPFQDSASSLVDFWGNGRGNNRSTGSFTVLEASYAEDGSVLSFAADFTQYDEGFSNWWTKGAIRYNSEAPVSLTPEPIEPEAPIDPIWSPDPDLSDPGEEVITIDDGFSLPPIVILPEPISEPPIHVDPTIDGDLSTVDPQILPPPDPIYFESMSVDSGYSESISIYPIFIDYIPFELDWYSGGSVLSTGPEVTEVFLSTGQTTPAPGPLPIAGAFAGWHSARRLRRRCRQRGQGDLHAGRHSRQP